MRRNIVSAFWAASICLSVYVPQIASAQVSTEGMMIEQGVEEVVPQVLGTNPITDGSDNVSKKEIKEALENLDGLLDDSSDVTVTKDTDSAAIVSTDSGTIIDLPKDPSDAVVLSGADLPSIEITLPQADESKKAKTIDDGVVAYPGKDGSANAVQVTEDGSVKMLTVIDNADAPTEYTYGITVPEGGHVELSADGGAIVLDDANQPLAVVNTPWAKDANGNSVDTWFTTDGVSLTQHVIHNVEGVVYPVTADPWVFTWYGVLLKLDRHQTHIASDYYSADAISYGILSYFPSFVMNRYFRASVAWYARSVYERGGCLVVGMSYVGSPIIYPYWGGVCR